MKTVFIAITLTLCFSVGCTQTAPTTSTVPSTQTNGSANKTADETQKVTTISGEKGSIEVKQSNNKTEITGDKKKPVKVETEKEELASEDDNETESTVKDAKGNRVTTKSRDNKKITAITDGKNNIDIEDEDGKNKRTNIKDAAGNEVKVGNGVIELRDANGKKVVIKTPN